MTLPGASKAPAWQCPEDLRQGNRVAEITFENGQWLMRGYVQIRERVQVRSFGGATLSNYESALEYARGFLSSQPSEGPS